MTTCTGSQGFKAERLQQVLRVRGLTNFQLAALANVSNAAVGEWCNGSRLPSLETAKKLSDLLNVRPEIFMKEYKTGLGKAYFRSNASSLKRGREMLKARMEWAVDGGIIPRHYQGIRSRRFGLAF
ncbi:helix-turn-helix domain-containing protein [Bombella sp. TMW 2.2559]|uniref:Helix-turn-helix domain-containing protein n=1 Tax=Bombella dulcis TaxID=2967339 RepID=A0ABT3WFN7_9PROT|nr:helix-turn-helix transcriptional regulator [Bombella dulcis]MCX5615701.1 helix-turn-helix domain-containing protein [Bombella dulcis]